MIEPGEGAAMSSDGYEDYSGPLTPHQQREHVWSAYSAGYLYPIRYGLDSDPVNEQAIAKMLADLGETDPAAAWRSRLLAAYAGGVNHWRKLAGEPEVSAS
jgi:hypothetical protein